jgi:hypothetical protein
VAGERRLPPGGEPDHPRSNHQDLHYLLFTFGRALLSQTKTASIYRSQRRLNTLGQAFMKPTAWSCVIHLGAT